MSASSPLPSEIHLLLHKTSGGEVRFVFKTCSEICEMFIADIRRAVSERLAATAELNRETALMLAKESIGDQIPQDHALKILIRLTKEAINQLGLSEAEKNVLRTVADQNILHVSDYRSFGFETRQGMEDVLRRMGERRLLAKQESEKESYTLCGFAALALKYGISFT